MANYIITNSDRNIINQSKRDVYVHIDLMDHDFKIINSLDANVISCDISEDATSSVRTTANLSMVVTKSSFIVSQDTSFWVGKYIQPIVKVKEIRTGKYIGYKLGVFLLISPSYSFDSSTNTLSMSCSDLTSTINGDFGGTMSGTSFKVGYGEKLYSVFSDLLIQAGIKKFVLEDIDNLVIPYDLEFNVGTTYYDVFKKIIDLYATRQMYFDVDGVFHVNKIPTCQSEPIFLDDDILSKCVISESSSNSFTDVYNKVEIWGSEIKTDYLATSCTFEYGLYSLTIPGVTSLEDGKNYTFTAPCTHNDEPWLKINSIASCPICWDEPLYYIDGGTITANNTYTVKYRSASNDFYLLGSFQAHTCIEEKNEDSPFHKNKIGTILKVFSDGDYAKIPSDILAYQRGELELFYGTRLTDSINLELVPIYFLHVNQKVRYTNYRTNKTTQYIIKKINLSLTGTMSVDMITFYDDDPLRDN